jgi:hypothetical protein
MTPQAPPTSTAIAGPAGGSFVRGLTSPQDGSAIYSGLVGASPNDDYALFLGGPITTTSVLATMVTLTTQMTTMYAFSRSAFSCAAKNLLTVLL